MNLYEYLEQPKSIEQLCEVVSEASIPWNPDQTKLYMMLHPGYMIQEDGRWVRRQDDHRARILQIIDKAMDGQRVVSISTNIMPALPLDLITTPVEVVTIATESGRYESPREDVLRHKK